MRDHAMQIFNAAVKAVQPETLIPRYLSLKQQKLVVGELNYDLRAINHIYLVSVGKAASAMAFTAEKILGDLVAKSIVITKYGHALSPVKNTIESGHPVPDDQSLAAGNKVLELLHSAGSEDLVILLLSGGASSLMESLEEDIGLDDLKSLSGLMLKKGLSISEINTIRKHLSRIKGGKFSAAAYPAKVHSLILSDVPGDDLSVIASGPTVADPSTFEDALSILKKYELMHLCPEVILRHLEKGASGLIPETPKQGDPILEKTTNILIGTNRIALQAAMARALQLGYNPTIVSDDLKGEASEQAKIFADVVRNYSGPIPACLLMGGETTVTIQGDGLGGRNQEFALAALIALQDDLKEMPLILSAGTDGTDGPTDATGALVDAFSMKAVKDQGIHAKEFLDQNNSYGFFKKTGGHIITGPTQTNVMDIVIALIPGSIEG